MAIPDQATNNDSTTTGYLQPELPHPGDQTLPGDTLTDYLQQFVAGIAGMDGRMVRPRWQAEPPNLPEWGIDWAAVGVSAIRPIGLYGAVIYHPLADQGNGEAEMQRHEEFDILATFYGRNASVYGNNLYDGLMIWQNKSALVLAGMGFVGIESVVAVPELIRERWWNRYDLTLTMRRIIRRTYNVRNLLEAAGWIHTNTGYSIPWSTARVTPPPPIVPPDHQHPIPTP
jgi:hypothetical protein